MTGFNDAFFKHIAFGDRALEIEIGVVDVVAAEKRKSICKSFSERPLRYSRVSMATEVLLFVIFNAIVQGR